MSKPQSLLRDPLRAFVLVMQLKLYENEHKGGWQDCSMSYLLRRLQGELGEVKRAMKANKTPDEVDRECADVANFAMMIADNYREAFEDQHPEVRG